MFNRAFRFKNAICRSPGVSVAQGLRSGSSRNPNPLAMQREHSAYVSALADSGLQVILLSALEDFPDSVFIEDAAVCTGNTAILTRPRAPSRAKEPSTIRTVLRENFDYVLNLDDDCNVDGGDVLLTDNDAFIGLSERTNRHGYLSLASILSELDYHCQMIEVPDKVLHFKSDCSLLDTNTILSTERLATTGCFDNYDVIAVPSGEEEAANLIRINDSILMRTGFPKTKRLLQDANYQVVTIDVKEAALIDGGLSCMSLRF